MDVMKKSSRLQSKYLERFVVSSEGTDSVTPLSGKGTEGKGGDFGDEPFSINQSTYPSKPNLATLSPSSSAVTHVGPGQGLLSLLVPLQRVPPERVVTLWPQVETGPSKIVRVLPSMRRLTVVSVVQKLGQPTILAHSEKRWEYLLSSWYILILLFCPHARTIPTEVRSGKLFFIFLPSKAQNELGPLERGVFRA